MLTYGVQGKLTFVLMVLTGLWPTLASAADSSSMKFYAVKEGKITYQFSGPQTGTETFYFTDYGNKTRRETHTNMQMMGLTQ